MTISRRFPLSAHPVAGGFLYPLILNWLKDYPYRRVRRTVFWQVALHRTNWYALPL